VRPAIDFKIIRLARVRFELETSALTLMMETELVSETLVFDSTLTRLIAQEDFITIKVVSFKGHCHRHPETLTQSTTLL
jgi:hypothetical protein